MSDSAAGVAAAQILSTEPAQGRARNTTEGPDSASDKDFASVLPEHVRDEQTEANPISIPVSQIQAAQAAGKILPSMTAVGSQFLPAGNANGGSKRIVASLSLDKVDGKLDNDLLSAAARKGPAKPGSSLSLLQMHLQQNPLNPQADAKLALNSQIMVNLDGADPAFSLSAEQSHAAANDRNAAQFALSQSVVTAREAGEGGISRAAVHVGPRFNHQDWGMAVAARVNWQVGERIQIAEFSINPPELGPVEVRISVDQDRTSVQFNVQNGLVKEALEDALPRLRELMAQSGMTLADSNVSQQSEDQQGNASQTDDRAAGNPAQDEVNSDEGMLSTHVSVRQGLVDDYI